MISCALERMVRNALMAHVTVDLKDGEEIAVKMLDALDGVLIALDMELAIVLLGSVTAIEIGEVLAVKYLIALENQIVMAMESAYPQRYLTAVVIKDGWVLLVKLNVLMEKYGVQLTAVTFVNVKSATVGFPVTWSALEEGIARTENATAALKDGVDPRVKRKDVLDGNATAVDMAHAYPPLECAFVDRDGAEEGAIYLNVLVEETAVGMVFVTVKIMILLFV